MTDDADVETELYQQLFAAWQKFRQGKKSTLEIDRFEYDLFANLAELAQEISAATPTAKPSAGRPQNNYRHGGYRRVVVQEKKRRDLAVALVRDRVVHRLIYDKLVEIFDKTFDPDVWSCRENKGLHKCLSRTQNLAKKYHENFIWRLDIAKFFDHVDHDILKACLRRHVQDLRTLTLCDEIINSYNCLAGGGQRFRGIPIGNLTSQIFANIYLNEFDRYVRHSLKPLAYVRYGDDAILFARTRREAKKFREQATNFLREELKLTVNPKNDVIFRADQPLKFLGHVITDTYIVVDRATTTSVLAKLNLRNIASYKSLKLAKWPKRELDWLAADQIANIIDQ